METKKTKILEEFADAANTLVNPEIKKWKAEGGRVIGYYCCYAPEEIITAAGFFAVSHQSHREQGHGVVGCIYVEHQL